MFEDVDNLVDILELCLLLTVTLRTTSLDKGTEVYTGLQFYL